MVGADAPAVDDMRSDRENATTTTPDVLARTPAERFQRRFRSGCCTQSGLPSSEGTPDFSLTKNRGDDGHRTRPFEPSSRRADFVGMTQKVTSVPSSEPMTPT